jgi:hypothetical protein
MNIWGELVKGTIGKIPEYFTRRLEIKAQKLQMESQERIKIHELKMAQADRQIELQKQGLTADANWEMEFAKQAASSWKDEYTLIVVSIPAVLCFIPGGAKVVLDGFKALSQAPVWYQVMLITLFFATVGIRYWRRTQYDTE